MMQILSLSEERHGTEPVVSDVLLDRGLLRVRQVRLSAGTRIPPCAMQDDVVFVVMAGQVTFRTEKDEVLVASPGAVFIPGDATTRSMEAREDSLVVAVQCRLDAVAPEYNGGPTHP